MGSTGGTRDLCTDSMDEEKSPGAKSGDRKSLKKGPFCARCRNHKELNRIQGHKRYCKYQGCTCTKCLYVKARQVVTANQVKEKRRSAIDEKLRSEGRLPSNSEPSIPTLKEELQSLASSSMNKTDGELDLAILDLFLARIHIDTEAFFEFVKPFIKEQIRKLQETLKNEGKSSSSSSSSTCMQSQDFSTEPSCMTSLIGMRTSDTSNMYSSMKREMSTSSTSSSLATDKMCNDNKIKKESARLIPLQSKSTTGQLSNLQWPAFNVNCAFPSSLASTDRSKSNVLELMTTNPLVSGAPNLSDEILAQQYRYLKAIQQLFPPSTYFSP